jgi:ABC-type spermidine/putrescine transport system permease subunit II
VLCLCGRSWDEEVAVDFRTAFLNSPIAGLGWILIAVLCAFLIAIAILGHYPRHSSAADTQSARAKVGGHGVKSIPR